MLEQQEFTEKKKIVLVHMDLLAQKEHKVNEVNVASKETMAFRVLLENRDLLVLMVH